jgi:uncharacterized phage protein (TIGR02220 family)
MSKTLSNLLFNHLPQISPGRHRLAKRFYDSEKFNDPWYRRLKPVHKCFWEYLLCACSHAGVWKVDMDTASWFIGETLEIKDLLPEFKDRVIVLNNGKDWFIPKFLLFQYGYDTPAPHIRKSILTQLKKYKIERRVIKELGRGWEGVGKELPKSPEGLQDKDKDNIITTTATKVIKAYNDVTGSRYSVTGAQSLEIIGARLKEGHTYEDCIKVIERKYDQWKDDPSMSKYIRIETLFRPTKFESYLNEKDPYDGVPSCIRPKTE